MIDPNALAAAYVAAGYTVMPLGQFPAHHAGTRRGPIARLRRRHRRAADVAAAAGAHGMDGSMAYALDPSSYASFPPIPSPAAVTGHHHGNGGYAAAMSAAQEHHRRAEMQF